MIWLFLQVRQKIGGICFGLAFASQRFGVCMVFFCSGLNKSYKHVFLAHTRLNMVEKLYNPTQKQQVVEFPVNLFEGVAVLLFGGGAEICFQVFGEVVDLV